MNWDKDWVGRPIYYDGQGQPMTMHQWAQKVEDEDYTHIARDVIGSDEPLDPAPLITVSTFWRGVNPNWRNDEPLIFETLIIGGGYDATGMRCATEKQAREGHRRGGRRAARRPRPAFRDYAKEAWDIPDKYYANRYYLSAHGCGMTGEYPYLYHEGDFPAAGYDGEILPRMTICVESYIGLDGGDEGVKLEQQVLITETGTELLSRFPFEDDLLK